jgi:4-amino-4-deoxy-L-arabinose transferase-like glycosyltransferase
MWLSASSLSLLGWADEVTLRGGAGDPGEALTTGAVEWAVRLPFLLCGLFGIFCVYLMCARLFGARAGLCAGLVLATSPIYFFISRQAMTDMPYVGVMSGGIALFVLGAFGEREPLPRRSLTLGRLKLGWPHHPTFYLFCVGFVLVMALQMAAIIPPLSRVPLGLRLGQSQVSAAAWMAVYAALALCALWAASRAKTRNELYLYGFYVAAALAGLSKGLAGALQPGLFVLLYLLSSGEWRLLREIALVRGLLIATCIFAPWYHGMLVRHGRAFWNQLFGTDHFRRLTIGEQAQAKGTWEYYIKQLGYALFPWVALLPAALARLAKRPTDARARAERFCVVWFLGAMLLFTLARTKYHYYFLPVIPPAAILVGLYLDDLLAGRRRNVGLVVLTALAVLGIVALDLARQPAHWVWLYTYLYGGVWAQGVPGGWPMLLYPALFGAALLLLLWSRLRRAAVWALLSVAVLVGGPVLNWHQLGCARHWSQKEVLKSYYRLRRGREEPLVAWTFNWRGETFYTGARVVVALKNDDRIRRWLTGRAGGRVFFVTEKGRLGGLRHALPTARGRRTLRVVDGESVHFVLAEAHL